MAVQCPVNSNTPDFPSRCSCNAGFSGAVAPLANILPFYSSTCVAVACPSRSAGNHPSQCKCNAGYNGTVTPTTTLPFFLNTCALVSCTANSNGLQTFPTICECDAGFNGSVVAIKMTPFYKRSIGGCRIRQFPCRIAIKIATTQLNTSSVALLNAQN